MAQILKKNYTILWNTGQVKYCYIWTFFPLMNSLDFFFGWYHSKNYKLGRNVCSLPKGSWTLFRMLRKTSGGMFADGAMSTHLQDPPSRIVQPLQMPWIFLYHWHLTASGHTAVVTSYCWRPGHVVYSGGNWKLKNRTKS